MNSFAYNSPCPPHPPSVSHYLSSPQSTGVCMCSEDRQKCSEQNTTHLTLHFLLPELVKYTISCPTGPHTRTSVLCAKILWLCSLKNQAKCNFAVIVNVDNPSSTDVSIAINPVIHPSHLGQRFSSVLKIPFLVAA